MVQSIHVHTEEKSFNDLSIMQFANLLSVIFSEPYVYRHPSSFLFDLISKHAKELSIESRHECEA